MSVESQGTMRVTAGKIRVFETFRMFLMEAKVNQIKAKTQCNILVNSLRPSIPPNQPTQYRVSRISELNEHAEADQEQFVFDLRVSPPTSPKSNVSPLRALHFYIGDDGDEISNQHGDVRAVVTEMPGEGDM